MNLTPSPNDMMLPRPAARNAWEALIEAVPEGVRGNYLINAAIVAIEQSQVMTIGGPGGPA